MECIGSQYPPKSSGSERHCCNVQATGCQNVQHISIWQKQCDGWHSGWWSSLMTSTLRHTEELIQTDIFVSLWHMAFDLCLPYSTVQHIMVDLLQYHKVCAKWLPCALTDNKKVARLIACLNFLHCHAAEGAKNCLHKLLLMMKHESIISFPPVSNQTWSGNTPAHTGRSLKWHHSLATIFWDSSGLLLVDFLEHGWTVNAMLKRGHQEKTCWSS